MYVAAAAAIGAAGSAYAAEKSAEAQEEAAQTQAEATRKAADREREMYQQSREDLAPYREAGANLMPQATYQVTGRMPTVTNEDTGLTKTDPDFTPVDVQESPMYQFRQREGEEAINRAMASRGQYGSSYAVNKLADLTTRLTAEETEKQYGRMRDLAGMGQASAAGSASAAQQTGGALGQYAMQEGQAQAQGQLGAGQQRASMYSNLSAMPMNTLNAYNQSQAYSSGNQIPKTSPSLNQGSGMSVGSPDLNAMYK